MSKLHQIINVNELAKNYGAYGNHKILERNVKVPLESKVPHYYSTLQVPKGFDLLLLYSL